ncbi:MAG: methyltransferase domain-containing protein [Anaerolineales bacterium]|nr:methyltransferase domain-containing protein [Anaerolineales bacterium]MCS7249023.1 methyltransferase domain-containing protein [Anaerolineales bacterium]MDW8162836.1 methyltransferase domain-containing protein [Anaerolineales bacterium]MDW8446341.1 methyltransferase domain-containing protein [Anaerolineales bacterium]
MPVREVFGSDLPKRLDGPPVAPLGEPPLLSYVQARSLLEQFRQGKSEAEVSLDLGLSTARVLLRPEGVILPDGQNLDWDCVKQIAESEKVCYRVEQNRPHPIRAMGQHSNWILSLMPTSGAPTLLVNGLPMHRIKDIEPWEDTRRKLRAAGGAQGLVLDTATGLGYTAILAARTAQEVLTVEIEAAVLKIARQNPWSMELFTNPRIRSLLGDSLEVIRKLPDGQFSLILHDPPTFQLAGELYSAEFYRECFRVLRPNGRMFHYVGDPQSKLGAGILRGVTRRLLEAGFRQVIRKPQAFGVLAIK